MSDKILEEFFRNKDFDFDIESPNAGHELRFLKKIEQQRNSSIKSITNRKTLWKPIIGIAATITLIIVFVLNSKSSDDIGDLANVSPEMAETQSYFASTINEELEKLEKHSTPETKKLAFDAMQQIKSLENDYEFLKKDLTESGNDNRVIYAMISNYQARIDILQTTLQHIDLVKELNNQTENSNQSNI